jgi:hypothetical protein
MFDKKLFQIILVHCFNQGFLITVGRLDMIAGSPCDVCGGQSGTATVFFSEYLRFPVSSFNQFTLTLKRLSSEGQAGKTCGTLGYGAQ